jgi:hypothetical protein
MSPQSNGYVIQTGFVLPVWLPLLAIGLFGLIVMQYRIRARRKPPIRKP